MHNVGLYYQASAKVYNTIVFNVKFIGIHKGKVYNLTSCNF